MNDSGKIKQRIWLSVFPSIIFLTILWLIFLINISKIFPFDLKLLGILPHSLQGFLGILLAPLIHDSFSHILSNSIPILVLSWCFFYFYRDISYKVFGWLWLLSGLMTWIIGREAYHIGASGLIFALVFFLFISGIIRKYIPLVAISLLVVFLYGSTIWSMLPITEMVDKKISWESHLSGALSGVFIAMLYKNECPQKPIKIWDEDYETEVESEEEPENLNLNNQ